MFYPLNLSFNLLYTIMVTNLPKFSSPTLLVHQSANVFPCENFALYDSVHLQWISQVQSVTHSRAYTHITSVCHRMYQLEREKWASWYVRLTSDIWISAVIQGYITVTAHFISELCSWVLLTGEIEEHHTGVDISERLLEAAKEWSITDECVSGLVRDNAANAVLGTDLTVDTFWMCCTRIAAKC